MKDILRPLTASTTKRVFLFFGLVSLIVFTVAASRPGPLQNFGFLGVGVLIGIFSAFLIEEYKRVRDKENLTVALFQEVVNRVAGCCYDFETPWKDFYLKPRDTEVLRVAKFAPEAPVIYPAVASQIAALDRNAVRAIIHFYTFLAAWRREIQDVVARYSAAAALRVPQIDVARLASRIRMTLEPGYEALALLGPQVPDAEQIELEAIAVLDRLFPESHPNAGKPLRERIEIVLRETEPPKR